MPDHCVLCERVSEPPSEFCHFHNLARRNLADAFQSWSKAYGGKLSQEDFFTELMAREETGEAVKKLILYLREKGAE